MPKHQWFNSEFHLPQSVKKTIPFLLFFAAISINIYFRLFPAYFPQLEQQAKLNVENKVIENSAKKVEDAYPDFNPLIKKKIILKAFEEDKKTTAGFKKEIQEEYKKLKDPYQDEHGQTYMLEVDGYQWMRYVKNILKNGHPGDRLENGYPYDDHMFAPIGSRVVPGQFFFYLSAFLFRFATFFLKNLSLVSFLFYLPLFYSCVFLVLLYFFVRFFFSDIAAFFSVIFIGLNNTILSHTTCGWFDYDSFVLLMPLIIIWILSLGLRNTYHIKKRMLYSLFAGFAVGIYAEIWLGYWWIFSVCGAYCIYVVINTYSLDKKAHKEALTYLFLMAIFFVTSLSLTSNILKTNVVKSVFITLQNALHLGASQGASVWPLTYYTVGELFKPTVEQIMRSLGGPIIATFALIGVLCIYVIEKRTEKKDVVMLMVFWVFVMVFASTRGVRFVAFLAIPLGIFFGVFIDRIFKYTYNKFHRKLGTFLLITSVFFIFIFWSLGALSRAAFIEANSFRPMMNDSWNKMLVYLEKDTPKNSIINSWWDYGNFFKTVSDRRVIFDPQSQDTTLSYWMAQAMLSEDESQAVNILRMLNNSSSTIFDKMHKEIKDNFQCVMLLKKILAGDEKEAKRIMDEQNISEELKNIITETIFSKEPAPAYLVVDKSMIYKMHNISFLGNWDFSKLYAIRNNNLSRAQLIKNLTEVFPLSKEQAEKIYNEVMIAGTEEESSEVLSRRYAFFFVIDKGNEEGQNVYFDSGVILNLSDFTARILTMGKGYKKYENVFIYDNSKLSVYKNKDTDYKESMLFVKDKDGWRAISLSKELAQSFFTKLYFFKATGLKYFEPFYADDTAGIYVYKIKWPNSNK